MNVKPVSSRKALDLYYLDARCQLLEIAAFLDRVERGGAAEAAADPRWQKVQKALTLLTQPMDKPDRAEQLLNLFS